MDFEHFVPGNFAVGNFAPARDFFYLAALLLGAGIGCILNRFRRIDSHQTTRRREDAAHFRNLSVTAGLCLFSGALAALTAASVYSNWMIFEESALFLPLGITAAVMALAFRFPKAAGFPLILAAGVFVVWMGYIWTCFPVADGSGYGRVIRDGNGSVYIRLTSPGGAAPDTSLSLQPAGEGAILEFRALRISVSKYFPLVGGVSRGVVAAVKKNNELLYEDPRLGQKFFGGIYLQSDTVPVENPGRVFSLQQGLGELKTNELPPGVSLTILFGESVLAFR